VWVCTGRRCTGGWRGYLSGQHAGLADRSHRPHSSPRQAAETVEVEVEVAVAEMRREHPRWGSRRIRLEMLRRRGPWAGPRPTESGEGGARRRVARGNSSSARIQQSPGDVAGARL
jgi:hypothetical protein